MHDIWIPCSLVILTVTALVNGCTCPSSPTNGYTSCSGEVSVGGVVHYYCYYGYHLEGGSTRTCRGVLGWSGNPPTCSREGCTCPSSPTNGYTSCSGEVSVGGVVHYYCNYRYRLEGDSTRTCRGALGWSGNLPTCSRVTCTCPPYPKNGYTTGCHGVANVLSDVDYNCYRGYRLVGSKTRTCFSTGSWFGDAPICVEIIDDPTTADSFFETDFDHEEPTYLSLAATLGISISVGSVVLILITGTLSVVAGIAYWRWARTSRIPERHNSTVPLLDVNDSVSENGDVQPTPSDVQDPPTSPPQKGGTETGPVDNSQLAGVNGDESSF